MNYPKEDNLLLLCSRTRLDRERKRKIGQILADNLDWDYLLEEAHSRKVSPLLYRHLKDEEGLPEKVKEDLKITYYTNSARNIWLLSKLGEILQIFREGEIPVIVLKGAALLETVYPDIGLRPITDLDLMVHRKDLPEIKEGLSRLGYENSEAYPEDFVKEGLMIDLHWELINVTRVGSRAKACKIEISDFWQNSQALRISGMETRVLSPEYLLIDLCLHLVFHHGLSGLVWFIDIAEVLRFYQEEIDWDKFVNKVGKYGIEKPLYYALLCVKEILEAPIPEGILDSLRPAREGFLEKKFLHSILNKEDIENARFFFTLVLMESLPDRIRFLRQIVLPSPGVLAAIYSIPPSRPAFPYYLLHLRRILLTTFRAGRKVLFPQ